MGAPNGYAAPGRGVPFAQGDRASRSNLKLVANEVARQWWGTLLSPATRNHMWIENGLARYSEILYLEHVNGAGAVDGEIHDTYVEALTVDQPPLIQSARLEDYSPEYWAETAGKGAAVLNMLRGVVGDENFAKMLKALPERFAWKSINTDDFRKVAEEFTGQSLQGFFLQWIESSGAPEFKMEYTVFRTQKGFRVVGKISQDLDTFRMPVLLHVETEGNPEEKTIEVVGTSSEFADGDVRQAEERRARSQESGAALRQHDARRGGDPARRAVCRSRRVFGGAEGISEGAGREAQQLAGALPHRRAVLPAEQLPDRRRTNFAKC